MQQKQIKILQVTLTSSCLQMLKLFIALHHLGLLLHVLCANLLVVLSPIDPQSDSCSLLVALHCAVQSSGGCYYCVMSPLQLFQRSHDDLCLPSDLWLSIICCLNLVDEDYRAILPPASLMAALSLLSTQSTILTDSLSGVCPIFIV